MNEWLSLSDAANMLGVHPSTVRVWSDKGILPVHKTQGGHRRYRRNEIALWAESSLPSRFDANQIMQEIIRSLRIQISEGSLEAESWYQKLDEEARAQYRLSGRSIFHGLMNYLASEGEDAETEAYAIGYEYASRARRYNLSYVDATRAFLFFRNVLVESVIKICGEAKMPIGQTSELYSKMHTFTDRILVSLLQTYESLGNAGR
ncbi:MAG: helix-turn-helix domain-containing protein [Anaerolineales bacterium]|nr:helix-turn-helix domain-containing protein [Anaerolineales bacterium]